MTEWTPEQQAVLDDFDRMKERQVGYFDFDMVAADRCACNHLVAEAGPTCPTCPILSCECVRHESRNRPLTEGGKVA